MTVLVTGGCGFVGSFVVRQFAMAGTSVVAFDVARDTSLLDMILSEADWRHVTVVNGDLLDLPHMLRLARKHGVDRIVHLGCMITLPTRANPALAQAVNIVGTNNVFELALSIAAPRVVWASTIDIFGPRSVSAEGTVANDAPCDPQGIYGGCKLLNELAARDYARDFKLDPVALRIPAAFGPGITRSWGRFIPQMIRDLVAGRPAQAPTLTKVMPWLYIEDVAEAFARAFDAPPSDALGYTLPGEERGVDDVISILTEAFPGGQFEPMDWPDFGTVPRYDGSAAMRHLNWQPRFGLAEGLHRTIAFYRQAVQPAS